MTLDSSRMLQIEAEAAKKLLAHLRDEGHGDDDELLANAVEGETSLHESIAAVIDRIDDSAGLDTSTATVRMICTWSRTVAIAIPATASPTSGTSAPITSQRAHGQFRGLALDVLGGGVAGLQSQRIGLPDGKEPNGPFEV